MTAPVRLQLSRRKGFDLQALSLATNGLPAVVVARPSRWGNPMVVGERDPLGRRVMDAALAVDRYRRYIAHDGKISAMIARDLRGRNLACWCAPGQPCHADVLLEFAN